MADMLNPDDENPAMLLWEQLKAWQTTPGGVTVLDQRSDPGTWWESLSRAVKLCDQTYDELISQAQKEPQLLGEIGPVVEACRRAIFSVSTVMTDVSDQGRFHIDDADLLSLRLFARSWQPVTLNEESRQDVIDLVRRVRDLVTSVTAGLDPEVAQYVAQLTVTIENTLLASRIWGTADLRAQTLQLTAALEVYFVEGEVDDQIKEEAKPLLVRLKNRASTTYWVDVVPKMVGAGISIGQKAIEGQILPK